jgi:hypothetical protein
MRRPKNGIKARCNAAASRGRTTDLPPRIEHWIGERDLDLLVHVENLVARAADDRITRANEPPLLTPSLTNPYRAVTNGARWL